MVKTAIKRRPTNPISSLNEENGERKSLTSFRLKLTLPDNLLRQGMLRHQQNSCKHL
ncbi:MAG: hypothetical protein ACOC4M_14655 [Promethearchaeia archaeon]